jgi:hypothetical protein
MTVFKNSRRSIGCIVRPLVVCLTLALTIMARHTQVQWLHN